MIRLRHWHDGNLILEDSMPAPAIQLLLKTAVRMIVYGSREKRSFVEHIGDIDVRLISQPRTAVANIDTIVQDDSTVIVRTWSEHKPTVEMWEID